MWWGIALGLVIGKVLRACADHLWNRWWAYNGRGNLGEQVRYWK